MKTSFFPKTKAGIWSVILFLLLVLLVGYFFLMVNVFNQRGGDTFFSNLNLTIPMLAAWACGVLSLILGLVAVFKTKSRAILVYIVLLLSALTTLYGIFAVASPY
jgi:uncharacterized membrane protein YphA (DoxX/SURF4 family)